MSANSSSSKNRLSFLMSCKNAALTPKLRCGSPRSAIIARYSFQQSTPPVWQPRDQGGIGTRRIRRRVIIPAVLGDSLRGLNMFEDLRPTLHPVFREEYSRARYLRHLVIPQGSPQAKVQHRCLRAKAPYLHRREIPGYSGMTSWTPARNLPPLTCCWWKIAPRTPHSVLPMAPGHLTRATPSQVVMSPRPCTLPPSHLGGARRSTSVLLDLGLTDSSGFETLTRP